jgi:hypothetical protein
MEKQLKIWVFLGQENGSEGICAMKTPWVDYWLPMVTGLESNLVKMERDAQAIANATGKTIKVVEYSSRTEIKTIEPE